MQSTTIPISYLLDSLIFQYHHLKVVFSFFPLLRELVSPFFPAAVISYFPSPRALLPRESPSNTQCIKEHHNPHNQKSCSKSFAPTSNEAYKTCASYTVCARVALPYQVTRSQFLRRSADENKDCLVCIPITAAAFGGGPCGGGAIRAKATISGNL